MLKDGRADRYFRPFDWLPTAPFSLPPFPPSGLSRSDFVLCIRSSAQNLRSFTISTWRYHSSGCYRDGRNNENFEFLFYVVIEFRLNGSVREPFSRN